MLLDVNVLIDAHRMDSPHHDAVADWLRETLESGRTALLADLVMTGFVRIVTSPRIFDPPSPAEKAMEFLDELLAEPGCRRVWAGPRHWEIMRRMIIEGDARANLVTDAHIAALAVEQGTPLVTRDRDFARFPGLVTIRPG
jgi:toxin-antitoxin system PIN domain toxin